MANEIPQYGMHVMPQQAGVTPFNADMPDLPSYEFGKELNAGMRRLDADALDYLNTLNNVRAKDALNKLREYAMELQYGDDGWAKKYGDNALMPDKNGNSLSVSVDKALRDKGAELTKDLTDQQRAIFDERASGIYLESRGGVESHMLKQSLEKADEVYKTAIVRAADYAGANYTDPVAIAQSMGEVRESVEERGKLFGWDKDTTEHMVKESNSAVVGAAFDAYMTAASEDDENVYRANSLLNSFKDHITDSALTKMRTEVNKRMDAIQDKRVGLSVVGAGYSTAYVDTGYNSVLATNAAAVAKSGVALPTANARMAKRAQGGSSATGAMVAPDAGVVTDTVPSAGNAGELDMLEVSMAYGAGFVPTASDYRQTMVTGTENEDATQVRYGVSQLTVAQAAKAAKLIGGDFNRGLFENDPEYNRHLGEVYYFDLLKHYGGDNKKAIAAYFTSEEYVEAAVAEADKNQTVEWMRYMPEAAAKRINKLAKNTEAVAMSVARAKGLENEPPLSARYAGRIVTFPTREELRQRILRSRPEYARNAERLERATNAAYQRSQENKEAYMQNQNVALQKALILLRQSGGDTSKIPSSLLNQLPITSINALEKYAKDLHGSSTVSATPPLLKALITDEARLRVISPDEAKTYSLQMSPADVRVFWENYANARRQTGAAVDQMNTRDKATEQGVTSSNFVPQRGWIERAAKTDPEMFKMLESKNDKTKIGSNVLLLNMQKELALEAQASGIKPDEVWVTEHTRQMLRSGQLKDGSQLFSMTADDLPKGNGPMGAYGVVKAITAATNANKGITGRDPTEDEMTEVLHQIQFPQLRKQIVIPSNILNADLFRGIQQEYIDRQRQRGVKRIRELSNYDTLVFYLLKDIEGEADGYFEAKDTPYGGNIGNGFDVLYTGD
jgi:hypothetical protein